MGRRCADRPGGEARGAAGAPFAEKQGWDGGEGSTGASKVQATPSSLKRGGVRFVILSAVQTSRTGGVLCHSPGERPGAGVSLGKSLVKARGFRDFPAVSRKGSPLPSPSRWADVRLWNSPPPAPGGVQGAPQPQARRAGSHTDMRAPFPLPGDKTCPRKHPGQRFPGSWFSQTKNLFLRGTPRRRRHRPVR